MKAKTNKKLNKNYWTTLYNTFFFFFPNTSSINKKKKISKTNKKKNEITQKYTVNNQKTKKNLINE